MRRRQFLQAGLGLTAWASLARAQTARVVIVGGGWGGLAAARQLRTLAPELDVILIEQHAIFRSRPLSNRWLVGLAGNLTLTFDYRATAARHGYRFIQDEVISIDRSQRRVVTHNASIDYDWLILAAGIREDFSRWFGADRAAAEFTQQHSPSGFVGSDDLNRLKALIENFKGGELVMTIPPMPYRCPPAPYERAVMIAWWLKERKIPGKLLILDPNPPMLSFDHVFRDSYAEQIAYLPQSRILSLDPYTRRIVTDFETIDFTAGILAPPQQAANIAWQAGLVGTSGWASAPADDERVFVIGDMQDKASTLFGYYPKTGQIAARQGAAAAHAIVQRRHGNAAMPTLPNSSCYVVQRVNPLEISRLDSDYRRRADGLIQQTVKQRHYPQAQDEDIGWAQSMFAELGLTTE